MSLLPRALSHFLLAALPPPAGACGLKLVLALDVSASVDAYEYDLQRRGIAAAFRDAEVQRALAALDGGLLVAVTQWGGPDQQALSLPWTAVGSAEAAAALAARLDRLDDPFTASSTAIGDALRHAGAVLDLAPARCRRAVIDLSGDGPANTGHAPGGEADALAARGVTINGLLVLVNPSHLPDGGVRYFIAHIVRGPGGFVMTAPDYEGLPAAFRRKLLREIAVPRVSAQATLLPGDARGRGWARSR